MVFTTFTSPNHSTFLSVSQKVTRINKSLATVLWQTHARSVLLTSPLTPLRFTGVHNKRDPQFVPYSNPCQSEILQHHLLLTRNFINLLKRDFVNTLVDTIPDYLHHSLCASVFCPAHRDCDSVHCHILLIDKSVSPA